MKCSNDLFEIFVILTQGSIITCLFLYLKWYLAIAVIIGIYILWNIYTKKILGYIPLTTADKILLGDDFFKRQLLMIEMEIENFNKNSLREVLINKGFKDHKKLSYKLIYSYFNFYWRPSTLSFEDTIKERIITLDPMTPQEIQSFKYEQLQSDFDPFITPIIFYIIPHANSLTGENNHFKGSLILKSDHILTDGLGLLTLLTFMSDDNSSDIFPKVMHQKKTNLIDEIIDLLIFILIGIPIIIYLIVYIKSTLKLSNEPRTKLVKFTENKVLDFEIVKSRAKQLKISFNELCLSSIVAASKRFSDRYNKEATRITIEVPIGLTSVPEKLEDVNLANKVFALFHKFRLISDPLKDIKIFQEDYKSLIRQALIARVNHYGTSFVFSIVPFNWAKAIVNDVVNNVDIIVTNVPGTTRNLSFMGNKVVDINPYATTGYITNFFIITTYNGKMKTIAIYDGGQKEADCQYILDEYEKIVNEVLSTEEILMVNSIGSKADLKEMKTELLA